MLTCLSCSRPPLAFLWKGCTASMEALLSLPREVQVLWATYARKRLVSQPCHSQTCSWHSNGRQARTPIVCQVPHLVECMCHCITVPNTPMSQKGKLLTFKLLGLGLNGLLPNTWVLKRTSPERSHLSLKSTLHQESVGGL